MGSMLKISVVLIISAFGMFAMTEARATGPFRPEEDFENQDFEFPESEEYDEENNQNYIEVEEDGETWERKKKPTTNVVIDAQAANALVPIGNNGPTGNQGSTATSNNGK